MWIQRDHLPTRWAVYGWRALQKLATQPVHPVQLLGKTLYFNVLYPHKSSSIHIPLVWAYTVGYLIERGWSTSKRKPSLFSSTLIISGEKVGPSHILVLKLLGQRWADDLDLYFCSQSLYHQSLHLKNPVIWCLGSKQVEKPLAPSSSISPIHKKMGCLLVPISEIFWRDSSLPCKEKIYQKNAWS